MKSFWVLLSLLGWASLNQAIAQPPAPGNGIVGIAHIALRVSDLDREIAFLGKLGYEEAFTIANAGQTMEVFVKINDHQFIELFPRTAPSEALGLMNVCYEAGDLEVLAKYYGSIGLQVSPVRKAAAGNLISSTNDPDGRVTQFTQYLPGSRHTLDQGQHLGANRVSTELMGFDLPVRDGAAEKEFYADLGFEAQEANGNVRLTAAGAPDLHLELRPGHPGAVPEFLFPVADARKAAEALQDAGLKPQRDDKLVFVHDPDGNVFVFLETGTEHKEGLLPWKH